MRNGLGTAHFFFLNGLVQSMGLAELLEKTLAPMGYELVDWENSPRGRLVRVFIDKAGGIDVEDCATVSHHLTRLFAVEGIDYDRLEVSSPGLDRSLKRPADFVRFAGEQAELRLHHPVENVRRLKGILRGCAEGAVLVETEQGVRSVPMDEIDRARLVPRIEWRKST